MSADPIGFENVKNEEFLRTSITKFWERYGGKTYEGLLPKLAIFAANVKEATDVVRPVVEKVLSELGISLSTVLVNTGDPSVTKMRILKILTTLMLLVLREVKSNLLSLLKRGERVGIVVHCLELLYLEVQNQKYLFYRLQCVA